MPYLFFKGPEGKIEAHYHLSAQKKSPTVIIMHPHPKHGGNMNSKMNCDIYKVFAKHGFNVLRFNYRGVGKSEGVSTSGEGEIIDAAAAIDWVQNYNDHSNQFWVAGFSFGAFIAMQTVMRRPDISGFVIIGPPANLYDFSFVMPCSVVGQVIQASNDNLVDTNYVDLFVARLKTTKKLKIDYKKIETDDHFLKNHTDLITEYISHFLNTYCPIQKFKAS